MLWFGLLGDTVWLLLHIYSLWMPYVLGASPQYAEMYARVFGRTTKLLPDFGNHHAPDAMHIFIDVFVIAVIVTTLHAQSPGPASRRGIARYFDWTRDVNIAATLGNLIS